MRRAANDLCREALWLRCPGSPRRGQPRWRAQGTDLTSVSGQGVGLAVGSVC